MRRHMTLSLPHYNSQGAFCPLYCCVCAYLLPLLQLRLTRIQKRLPLVKALKSRLVCLSEESQDPHQYLLQSLLPGACFRYDESSTRKRGCAYWGQNTAQNLTFASPSFPPVCTVVYHNQAGVLNMKCHMHILQASAQPQLLSSSRDSTLANMQRWSHILHGSTHL